MRVFLTGATGFIGTEVIRDLIKAGHTVLGLTRSEKGAEALDAAGAEAHRGDLGDLDSLRRGAGGRTPAPRRSASPPVRLLELGPARVVRAVS